MRWSSRRELRLKRRLLAPVASGAPRGFTRVPFNGSPQITSLLCSIIAACRGRTLRQALLMQAVEATSERSARLETAPRARRRVGSTSSAGRSPSSRPSETSPKSDRRTRRSGHLFFLGPSLCLDFVLEKWRPTRESRVTRHSLASTAPENCSRRTRPLL
jgi:hypothetical protein